MNERETAFLLLQRVELFGTHSSGLLAQQSSYVREVSRGVLRWRLRLDYVISQLSNRPVKKIDQRALQILRIAVCELVFMNSPAYALVNEAVALAARHARRARGFVNAVLRAASRADLRMLLPEGDSNERVAVELAHPAWLLERWKRQFGAERALKIAAANQEKSRADLLVNTRSISIREAEDILRRKAVGFDRSKLVDRLVRLHGSSSAVKDEIDRGLIHPMDEGSAVVASLIRQEDRLVLDAAAAPGGKSLFLELRGHDVCSQDRAFGRLAVLRRLFHRFDRSDHVIVAGDAARPPFRRRFDSLLLDAPCSGTGTIRKNPEIKWRLDPDCFQRFAATQRELLNAVLPLAENECVYSTCSLEAEENDEVVGAVLRSNPEFERVSPVSRLGAAAKEWVEGDVLRLTPESGTDGFTAFLLRRKR